MNKKSRIGLATSLTIITIILSLNYAGQAISNLNILVLASYPIQVVFAVIFSHMIFSLSNSLFSVTQPEEYRHHAYLTAVVAMHIALAFSTISNQTSADTAVYSLFIVNIVMVSVGLVTGISHDPEAEKFFKRQTDDDYED